MKKDVVTAEKDEDIIEVANRLIDNDILSIFQFNHPFIIENMINATREGLKPVPIRGIIIAKTAKLGITLKQLKRLRITFEIILFL